MKRLFDLRKLPVLPVIVFVFVLAACAGRLQAQQKFGYVLDVRGDWLLNGGTKLAKGSALNVGGVITAANPADSNSYIVVADRSGGVFQKRSCGAGECADPIRIPNSAGVEQSMVSRLIGAAMALVSNEPTKYSSFVSRGTDLREAVVKLNANQIDVQEVFRNMQGDRYLVRFEQIGKNGHAGAPAAKPFPFDWNPKKPIPLAARGLAPGLYRVSIAEVSLLGPDAAGEPSDNEAWVLVATPARFAKAAPSFSAAQNVTKQWGADVKQTAVREFLRASLDFMSAQNTP